jgi:hypothetical protein
MAKPKTLRPDQRLAADIIDLDGHTLFIGASANYQGSIAKFLCDILAETHTIYFQDLSLGHPVLENHERFVLAREILSAERCAVVTAACTTAGPFPCLRNYDADRVYRVLLIGGTTVRLVRQSDQKTWHFEGHILNSEVLWKPCERPITHEERLNQPHTRTGLPSLNTSRKDNWRRRA